MKQTKTIENRIEEIEKSMGINLYDTLLEDIKKDQTVSIMAYKFNIAQDKLRDIIKYLGLELEFKRSCSRKKKQFGTTTAKILTGRKVR